MRLLSAGLCTMVAAALLAGCSGGSGSSPSSSMPGGAGVTPPTVKSAHGKIALTTIPKYLFEKAKHRNIEAPEALTRGLATAEFLASTGNIIVYPKNNSANGPPRCNFTTGQGVNDFASDEKGDLIIPNAFSGVDVYAPRFKPKSCGRLLGTIPDSLGQAADAAAKDAKKGTIVVGNLLGGPLTGILTCTLASLTCTALNSPNMATGTTSSPAAAGVAMDKAGNCYADAFDTSGAVGLWIYAGCAGKGKELTSANGFSEPYYGGIDVDNRGNIVVISLFNSTLSTPSEVTVYSGCSTGTCKVVSGPTALAGASVFGHLGRQNERYAVGDVLNSDIEVYSYSHGALGSMLYSFNNGLSCATDECEAAVYMPRSPR